MNDRFERESHSEVSDRDVDDALSEVNKAVWSVINDLRDAHISALRDLDYAKDEIRDLTNENEALEKKIAELEKERAA